MANGNGRGISEDEYLTLISDQFPQIIGQVEQGISGVFDEPGLTPEEEDRLSRLDQQAQVLQPIDIQSPQGSSRIPGNPYSYDVNPAIQGAQQGIEGIINAVRQKRLAGDPQEAKNAQEKINQAETELKQLQKDSLKDMSMMGPGASEDLTEAVSGDKKQRMEQLRREIENQTQRLRQAKGVTGQRADLLEKKEEAQQADESIRTLVENISPRVAQTMFDRQEQQQRLETQHDLTLEEIEARHDAKMEEIQERYGESGTSDIPAQTLSILSDNVEAVQEKMNSEISSLENQKARMSQALQDEEVAEIVKGRLPEDTTIEDRINELDTEIEKKRGRLERSIKNMIEVAAERNNLDKRKAAELLGQDPDEVDFVSDEEDTQQESEGSGQGGSQTTQGSGPNQQNQQGQQQGNKTMTQEDLQEYAENTSFNGDTEKARAYLESQGFTITGN